MSIKEMIMHKSENMLEKILGEIYDFICFLSYKQEGKHLMKVAQKLSENSFRRIWGNKEDAVYDDL
ncbi:MAG: toxin-antitoxin system, antitoxin component, Xre family protein [Calditrichaeota bacterium]|nr:MAG: toxin-antitoxin system, antitoxin component, Xre family protein [Calditrichota bacterium]